jgi:hypothetical protein
VFKNSREILEQYLPELTAPLGLSLAKCRPGDFAVYRFGSSSVAVAALNVSRAHEVRRFDGFIGVAPGEGVVPVSRGRIELGGVFGLHIFNLRPLLSAAFIDEADVRGSIERFLGALDGQLSSMLNERLPDNVSKAPIKITLTPVVSNV